MESTTEKEETRMGIYIQKSAEATAVGEGLAPKGDKSPVATTLTAEKSFGLQHLFAAADKTEGTTSLTTRKEDEPVTHKRRKISGAQQRKRAKERRRMEMEKQGNLASNPNCPASTSKVAFLRVQPAIRGGATPTLSREPRTEHPTLSPEDAPANSDGKRRMRPSAVLPLCKRSRVIKDTRPQPRLPSAPPGRANAHPGRSEGSTVSQITSKDPNRPSTSRGQAAAPIKPRHARSYRDVAANPLEMVVYNKNNEDGKIPEELQERFQKALNAALDQTLCENPTTSLNFLRAGFKGSRYHICCQDNASTESLVKITAKLEGWEGTNLGVLPAGKIPRLTRVTVWIPGVVEEPATLFARIKLQNKDLKTEKWKLYHVKEQAGKGQLITVGIDEESLGSLVVQGGKALCGFHQVSFVIPSFHERINEGNSSKPSTQ